MQRWSNLVQSADRLFQLSWGRNDADWNTGLAIVLKNTGHAKRIKHVIDNVLLTIGTESNY